MGTTCAFPSSLPAPACPPAAIRAAEDEAFRRALLAAIPRLRRHAAYVVRDPGRAEDLVQDTLLRAWEHRDRFTLGTQLMAWLRVILRNTAANARRRHRLEVEDPDARLAARAAVPAGQDWRLDLDDVARALGRMPAEQREALLLIGIEDLSYDQAARILGCEPGTVKSRVSRGRARLSDMVGRDAA
ncbi:sigma-70 family RNA polymerase sigma factor [Methylobacterium sp. JK268]